MGRSLKVITARHICEEARDMGLITFSPILERYRAAPDTYWIEPPTKPQAAKVSWTTPFTAEEIHAAFRPERERDQREEDQ